MMQGDDEVCEMEGREHSLSSPTIYVLQVVIYFLIVCHIMSMRTPPSNVIIAVAALAS